MAIKPKILAVDDEPKALKLLAAILCPQGYDVLGVGCGREALERIEAGGIDLVLLDVMMPGMDGFEVLRKIRDNEISRLMPVVFLTALSEVENRVKGIEAGCDDFISKPFDRHEVLARVKMLLKMDFYRRQLDEKEKFEAILDRVDYGILLLSRKLEVVRFNEAAGRLLYIREAGPVSDFIRHMRERFKVNCPGELRQDLLKKALTFEIEREETAAFKKLILEARTSVISNPATGEIANIMMIVRDVTEEKNEEMVKRNFLSHISHKLNTPLSTIKFPLEMLKSVETAGPLNGAQENLIDTALHSCSLLEDSIKRLLKYTSATGRRGLLKKERIPVFKEVMEAGAEIRKIFRGKETEFVFRPEEVPAEVFFDRECLRIVFSEVLSNAVKFNDKPVARIEIKTELREDRVRIIVADNGPGIPPEEHENIFKKFSQVEKYFTGNVKGTGLGLALAKELLESGGGMIKVSSTPPRRGGIYHLPSGLPRGRS